MDYDITIYQGATFTLAVTITDDSVIPVPIDLTGHVFRGQVRSSTSSDTIQASFTGTLTDAVNGEVLIEMTDAESAGIEVPENCQATRRITRMVYDIESVGPGGEVRRWLQGIASISPEVTR